jgi:hypothetical protein
LSADDFKTVELHVKCAVLGGDLDG